ERALHGKGPPFGDNLRFDATRRPGGGKERKRFMANLPVMGASWRRHGSPLLAQRRGPASTNGFTSLDADRADCLASAGGPCPPPGCTLKCTLAGRMADVDGKAVARSPAPKDAQGVDAFTGVPRN
ncbi:MAG TPA: hypothetical protein VNA31_08035, partial [bacterium]|nr:hypothetical protein [bacterium]